MAIAAAELLGSDKIDAGTRLILNVVAVLDSFGAREWNLRWVAVVTCLFLFTIRHILKEKAKVHWAALLHNVVTGLGSAMAVYLDFYSSETLTGIPEPLRSCVCAGPLTSIHRILPAISMGYGVMDMIDGFKLGPEFVAHGVATFFIMTFFVESNLPQIVVPFLLMEMSSIFLCLCKATFLNKTMTMVVQLLFALNFFVFRILITPFIWFKLVKMMYEHSGDKVFQSCFHGFVMPVSIGVGIFFHCLNAFWMYKIVRKLKRTFSGEKGKPSLKKSKSHPVYDDEHDHEPHDKENVHGQSNGVAMNGRQNAAMLNGKKTK